MGKHEAPGDLPWGTGGSAQPGEVTLARVTDAPTVLLDACANSEVQAEWLVQFAQEIGADYRNSVEPDGSPFAHEVTDRGDPLDVVVVGGGPGGPTVRRPLPRPRADGHRRRRDRGALGLQISPLSLSLSTSPSISSYIPLAIRPTLAPQLSTSHSTTRTLPLAGPRKSMIKVISF